MSKPSLNAVCDAQADLVWQETYERTGSLREANAAAGREWRLTCDEYWRESNIPASIHWEDC